MAVASHVLEALKLARFLEACLLFKNCIEWDRDSLHSSGKAANFCQQIQLWLHIVTLD